jgi:anti-anti-sigma factor
MGAFHVGSRPSTEQARAWHLTMTGDLDKSSVDAFDSAIRAAIDVGARLVVLDLGNVTFLDSAGLRSIMRAASMLADQGGRLTVGGLSGAAQRVLEVTGLLEILRPDSAGMSEVNASDGAGS